MDRKRFSANVSVTVLPCPTRSLRSMSFQVPSSSTEGLHIFMSFFHCNAHTESRRKGANKGEYHSGKWRDMAQRFQPPFGSERSISPFDLDRSMSKVFAASSLWCTYSKLKTILRVREKVDVSSFTNVVSFLKKMSVRHVPRKSNVLSRSQIDEFLLNAPDDVFLLIKVVIAFGVFGAYRRQELHDLCFNDVKVEGSILVNITIYLVQYKLRKICDKENNESNFKAIAFSFVFLRSRDCQRRKNRREFGLVVARSGDRSDNDSVRNGEAYTVTKKSQTYEERDRKNVPNANQTNYRVQIRVIQIVNANLFLHVVSEKVREWEKDAKLTSSDPLYVASNKNFVKPEGQSLEEVDKDRERDGLPSTRVRLPQQRVDDGHIHLETAVQAAPVGVGQSDYSLRLFWNQIFTCVSVNDRDNAKFSRSQTERYLVVLNLFSRATNCSYVNAVRALRGFPPPLPLPLAPLPSLPVALLPIPAPLLLLDFFFLPLPPLLLLLPLLLFPSRSSLTSLPNSSLLLLVSSRSSPGLALVGVSVSTSFTSKALATVVYGNSVTMKRNGKSDNKFYND
ncbi:hypothetical protein C0J52_14989 [Blattella germanica]|nr:hypothetical protein C0J52_14989 [Blattella germanica]